MTIAEIFKAFAIMLLLLMVAALIDGKARYAIGCWLRGGDVHSTYGLLYHNNKGCVIKSEGEDE